MCIAAFLHFFNLITVASIQFFYAALETQSFWVVAVGFILALQRTDYAVKLSVFA